MMDEFDQIMTYIEDAVGQDANIKIGDCYDENLEDQLRVTLIVTGFEVNNSIKPLLSSEKNIVSEIPASPVAVAPPVIEVVAPVVEAAVNNEEVVMTRIEKTEEAPANNENFAFQNYDSKWNVPNAENNENIKNVTYLNSNAEIISSEIKPVNESEPAVMFASLSLDEMEMLKRSQERASKLKGFNFDLNKPVEDMEDQINTPAFMRLNLQLDEEIHSSERISSNISLNTENKDKPLFNTNNSFFNPEVD